MAESHAKLGRRDTSDRLYREWLDAEPAWGWGWIGWADTYFLLLPDERHDLARAEAILRKGLAVPDVRDREDVLDRLAALYEDSGRAAEAADVRRQIKALLAQPRLTMPADQSGSAKVSFEFGEDGPSIERLPDIVAKLPKPAELKAVTIGGADSTTVGGLIAELTAVVGALRDATR